MTNKIQNLAPCVVDTANKDLFFSKYHLNEFYHFRKNQGVMLKPCINTFDKSVHFKDDKYYTDNHFNSINEMWSAYLEFCKTLLEKNPISQKTPFICNVYDRVLLFFNKPARMVMNHQKQVDVFNYLNKLTNDRVFQEQEFNSFFNKMIKENDENKEVQYLKLPFDENQSFFILRLNDLNALKNGYKLYNIDEYQINEIYYNDYEKDNLFKPNIYLTPKKRVENHLYYQDVRIIYKKNDSGSFELFSSSDYYEVFLTLDEAEQRIKNILEQASSSQ